MLQSTALERLHNKEISKENWDTWSSLGNGNKRDSLGKQGVGRDGNMSDQVDVGIEGKINERNVLMEVYFGVR